MWELSPLPIVYPPIPAFKRAGAVVQGISKSTVNGERGGKGGMALESSPISIDGECTASLDSRPSCNRSPRVPGCPRARVWNSESMDAFGQGRGDSNRKGKRAMIEN